MKSTRSYLLIVFCLFFLASNAQDKERRHSLGLYQTFTDFNVQLLDGDVFVFDSSLSHSTRLAYQYVMSRSWALNAGLNNGFILNQDLKDSYVRKAYTFGADASIMLLTNNGRIFSENARVAPYLLFGYRVDYVNTLKKRDLNPYLMHSQYALGLNIKLNPRTHIQLQSALDQKLTGDFNTHMRYRMGITQSIGGVYEGKNRNRLLDSDKDGIIDANDKCPGVFGLEINDGCPDTNAQNNFSQRVNDLLAQTQSISNRLDSLMLANHQLTDLINEYDQEIIDMKDSLANCSGQTTLVQVPTLPPPTTYDTTAVPLGDRYYLVVKSLKQKSKAEEIRKTLEEQFGNGFLLKQPSGFYRVAVYAGKSYSQAVELMPQVEARGYSPVWITKE
ncbi:MAG: SPOR domain-containing protein [Bacteroidia bacterium]